MMNLDRLFDPFPEQAIHWRVGATNGDKTTGIALAYLDARNVMERLDGVCGAGNWQCRYPFPGCCEIGIRVIQKDIQGTPQTLEWVWKANGAGETQVEGEKGQYSDAFKRAGVMWGIGQYLYSLPNEWVPIKKAGNSYKLSKRPSLPAWAKPGQHRFTPGEKDKIIKRALELMEAGDGNGLNEFFADYQDDQEIRIKVWSLFNSWQRDSMKKLME